MALPAIIGLVARSAAAGAVRASGLAAVTGRAAASAGYQGLRSGLVKAGRGFVASQKNALVNTAFESASSVLANRRAEREERLKGKDSSIPKQKRSNKEKAEGDEHENRERHERARDETLKGQGEESVSVLKVISHDTKDILAGIELLVEGSSTKRDEGNGLLGKIVSVLGGLALAFPMFSKNFIGSLGGFFTKTAAKIGTTISSILTRALSGVLGTVVKAGSGVARAAGSVGRAALGAGAAILAKGSGLTGALSRSGAAGAKAALGTTGALVAKSAGKSLLKKVPLLGAGVGLGLAGSRAYEGDWTGAGLEAASGIASILPGPGTAASLGLDAAILARDMSKSGSDSGGSGGAGSTGEITAAAPKPTSVANPVGSVSDIKKARSLESIYLDQIMQVLNATYGLLSSPRKGAFVKFDEYNDSNNQRKATPASFVSGAAQNSSESKLTPPPPQSEINSALTPLSENASAVSNANGSDKAILDLIAKGESGKAGYDAAWNGSRVKPSKPLSQMTLGEVRQWQKDTLNEQISRGVPQNRRSSAAGRYQFISGTLASTMQKAGLKDDDLFSPENQDKLALTLLDANKNKGISAWRSGKASDAEFADYVASQWASFKNSSGKGTYDAAGFNHGSIGMSDLISAGRQTPKIPLQGTGNGLSPVMRESVMSNNAAQKAPVIIQQPVVAPVAPQKTPMAQASGGSSKPMYVRSPDSPIQAYSRMIIAGVA